MNRGHHSTVHCEECGAFQGSLLCTLTHGELVEIEEQKTVIPYRKGEVIFRAGTRPNGMFCILSGKVKLTQLDDFGNEQITRFAMKGEVIGYRAFLGRDVYQASAVAIDDVKVCHLPESVLLRLMSVNHDLTMSMMTLLSDALRNAEYRISRLTLRTVRERVAEALLLLQEKFGYEEDGKTLAVVLSRQDIADLAGTVRETATKMLSELNSDKIIALEGKRIVILDRDRLFDQAGLVD